MYGEFVEELLSDNDELPEDPMEVSPMPVDTKVGATAAHEMGLKDVRDVGNFEK